MSSTPYLLDTTSEFLSLHLGERQRPLFEVPAIVAEYFPDAWDGKDVRDSAMRRAEALADSLGNTAEAERVAAIAYAGELIAAGRFDDALTLVAAREHSFWLVRDVERKSQWEACRRMAELGSLAVSVRAAVARAPADARSWVAAYVASDGWHRLDRAQRRLESWVAKLAEEPAEKPLGIVRRAYDDACHAMAEGFRARLSGEQSQELREFFAEEMTRATAALG
jgi:hypothetical protein